MAKPIESLRQFHEIAKSYCPYIRRVQVGAFRCSIVQRATGDTPCDAEDWKGCLLNNGGHPKTTLAEMLS